MRTVWLALFCLIGIATMVLVKIGISPYATADVSRGDASSALADVSQKIVQPAEVATPPANKATATNIQNTSAKGDKLEASHTSEPSGGADSVKTVLIAPAQIEPEPKRPEKTLRIMSRHWHDPFDKRSVPAVASAKRKLANANTVRRRVVSAGAPKP